MEFRSITTYKVDKNTYMDKIFPKGLPVNAFINKGRCGIGGTSWEVKNKTRSTLIIVPNIGIIKNKLSAINKEERPDYGIWGDTLDSELAECALDEKVGIKVMCTPESIKRFLTAMGNRRQEIFNTWLLLLDESHTFISELYRENILLPFKYYDRFKQKTIISATPYLFSDPKFYELDYHQIIFTETLGFVSLVNAVSVDGTLKFLIEGSYAKPFSYHIFYNSVTAIRDIVQRSEITSCAIHCADSAKNRTTLGDLTKFMVDVPCAPYHKLNFYTCKHFEGWDLPMQDAVMILVTDIYKKHTLIGVGTKGKQAIGRLRGNPKQVIHVTNHNNHKQMLTFEHFRDTYSDRAAMLIEQNNQYQKKHFDPKFYSSDGLKKLADINEQTGMASLNLLKLDQQVNESTSNEIYRNIEFIKEDWEKSYYEVKVIPSNHPMPTNTQIQRQSQADKLKGEYYIVKDYNTPNSLSFTTDAWMKSRYPLAYAIYHSTIQETDLIEWKFKPKKVESKLNEISDNHKITKLMWEAKRIFLRDRFYFNSHIAIKLQELYNKFQILNSKRTGIAKAEPKHLQRFGFKLVADKRRNKDGNYEHGYWINEKKLDLKILD